MKYRNARRDGPAKLFIQQLETRCYLAADFELVAPLDDSLLALVAKPQHYAEVAGGVVFSGTTPAHGSELWFSDLQTGGTRLVADITPGRGWTAFSDILSVGEFAIATTNEQLSPTLFKRAFYATDGTLEGTKRITFNAVNDLFDGSKLTVVGDRAYLASNGELFVIDPATATATPIPNATDGFATVQIQSLFAKNSTLYYTVQAHQGSSTIFGSTRIYALDTRTPLVQPRLLHEFNDGATHQIIGVGDSLWVAGLVVEPPGPMDTEVTSPTYKKEFSKVDLVTGFVIPWAKTIPFQNKGNVVVVNDSLWFTENDEVWKTNPESPGAHLIVDTGLIFGGPMQLVVLPLGNKYFLSLSDIAKSKIYITDGTADGTQAFNGSYPILNRYSFDVSGSALPPAVQRGDDDIYFLGAIPGNEVPTTSFPKEIKLFRFSPDETSPSVVHSFSAPDMLGSAIGELGVVGNRILFSERDPKAGEKLTAFDTRSQTTFDYLALDPRTNSAQERFDILGSVGGRTYFSATRDFGVVRYFVTDGTPTGTVEISEEAGLAAKDSLVISTTIGDNTYYLRDFGDLMRIGPTGIVEQVVIRDGVGAQRFGLHSLVDGRLYFSASGIDGNSYSELYVIDNTDPEPQQVNFGEQLSKLHEPMVRNGETYIWTNDLTDQDLPKLWKIDTSNQSASVVLTLTADLGGIRNTAVLEDYFYFTIYNRIEKRHELWRTNGIESSTERFAIFSDQLDARAPQLIPGIPGTLLVSAEDSRGTVTYKIDPVNDKLSIISESLAPLQPGGSSLIYANNGLVNGRIFSNGFDPKSGEGYWVTDGTVDGTRMLGDFVKGSGGDGAQFTRLNSDTLIAIGNRPDNSNGWGVGTGTSIWKLDITSELAPHDNTSFLAFENSSGGTYVGRIELRGIDSNSTLAFEAVENSPFLIDSATGEISIGDATALDFETKPRWAVDVKVTITDPLTNDTMERIVPVTIGLLDSNDQPRIVSINGQSFGEFQSISIPRDVSVGTVIGRIVVSDQDPGKQWEFGRLEGPSFINVDSNGFLVVANSDIANLSSNRFTTLLRLFDATDNRSVGIERKLHQRLDIRFDIVDSHDAPWGMIGTNYDPGITAGTETVIEVLQRIPHHPDNEGVTITATLEDGSPLPSWMIFAPERNNALTVRPWNGDAGIHRLLITAEDESGNRGSIVFPVTVRAVAAIWQNPLIHADVDNDGRVLPIDALRIINNVARHGSRMIDPLGRNRTLYFDVSGDNRVTPLDALRVINEISRQRHANKTSEGEAPRTHLTAPDENRLQFENDYVLEQWGTNDSDAVF